MTAEQVERETKAWLGNNPFGNPNAKTGYVLLRNMDFLSLSPEAPVSWTVFELLPLERQWALVFQRYVQFRDARLAETTEDASDVSE